MIIIMRPDASDEQINHVVEKLKQHGFGIHLSKGVEPHCYRCHWRQECH